MGKSKDRQWFEARKKFMDTPGVLAKLTDISKKYGFTVKELVDLIGHESSFKPNSRNRKSKATGLIQFMPKTAKGLGTSTSALGKMSILGQLDFVDKYFKQNHKKGAHPYMTVAYPKAGNWDPHKIIAKKGSKIANQNPGWVDVNGNVTRASIENFVNPDGDKVYDPEKPSRGKQIQRKEQDRQDFIRESRGTIATRDNVERIMSKVNFINSTIDGKVFDVLEDNIMDMLSGKKDPNDDNTDLERVSRKFINNYDSNELETDFPIVDRGLEIVDVKQEFIDTYTNEAAEGGIQPNGRVSTFTRDEDIAAQKNTYKQLNIF